MVKHIYKYKKINGRRELIKNFRAKRGYHASKYRFKKQQNLLNPRKVIGRFVSSQRGYRAFRNSQRIPYKPRKGHKKIKTKTYSWYPKLYK